MPVRKRLRGGRGGWGGRACESMVELLQENILRGEQVLVRLDERALELRRDEEAGLPNGATGVAEGDVATPSEEGAREEQRWPASLPAAAPFEDPAYDHADEVEVQDRVAEARPAAALAEDPAYDLAIEIMRRELLPTPAPVSSPTTRS